MPRVPRLVPGPAAEDAVEAARAHERRAVEAARACQCARPILDRRYGGGWTCRRCTRVVPRPIARALERGR
jgi:ribosomal protein L37AE/L43A